MCKDIGEGRKNTIGKHQHQQLQPHSQAFCGEIRGMFKGIGTKLKEA